MAYTTHFSTRTIVRDELAEKLSAQGYGVLVGKKLQLSVLETLYLTEKGVLILTDDKEKLLSFDAAEKKAEKMHHDFWIKYAAYKDLRSRGYVVKTAFKFGADFSVYDKGVKPGDDHSRWIVYPVHESKKFSWHDFSAKNRIAHTTKKRLMLALVDDEGSVTYFEVRWMRP